MTLPLVHELTYAGGLYADPVKTTELVRFFQNGQSAGVAASLIVCKRPALVAGFTVSSVSAQFIQVFDSEVLPADTAVPTLVYPVAATNVLGVSWLPWPRAFRLGVVLCNSSTQHTKTIGSADCIFDVQYI